MADGVDYEAAEAVCAQYGSRLVSSSSLEERQDLLELSRNKRGGELEEGGRSGWLTPLLRVRKRCLLYRREVLNYQEGPELIT